MRKLITLTLAFSLLLATPSLAHSGRTDGLGGHYVRTAGKGYPVGTYHYHRGKYKGCTVEYKGQIPAKFKKAS